MAQADFAVRVFDPSGWRAGTQIRSLGTRSLSRRQPKVADERMPWRSLFGRQPLMVYQPPTSPDPGYVSLAAAVPDVADALGVLGQADPLSWVALYKLFEIIRDNVKPHTLDGLGWTTKNELSAFTASANRPDLSGIDARHARMAGINPPKVSMTLSEGRRFMIRVVNSWLVDLRAKSNSLG